MIVTGGNQGLGLYICQAFGATSVSRSNGYDIGVDQESLVQATLNDNIFVNNAYDGEFGKVDGKFAQTQLLNRIALAWKQLGKTGHIINIGGSASSTKDVPDMALDLYAANKAALRYHSHQWSRAFKHNTVKFKTTLLNIDRLSTDRGRQSPDWNGNGHELEDIIKMINLCLTLPDSVCIEEITAWVNLDHKQ